MNHHKVYPKTATTEFPKSLSVFRVETLNFGHVMITVKIISTLQEPIVRRPFSLNIGLNGG